MPRDSALLQFNGWMRLPAAHADVLKWCGIHRLFDVAEVKRPTVDAEAGVEPMVHPPHRGAHRRDHGLRKTCEAHLA